MRPVMGYLLQVRGAVYRSIKRRCSEVTGLHYWYGCITGTPPLGTITAHDTMLDSS